MLRSWKLGTAFGIGIYIHWTFLLLPLWVLLNTWGVGGDLYLAVYSLAFVLTVFGCVVLHELGHALAARRFGVSTRDITLYPIGGVARLERMPERPVEEFLIAIAGPAVNVVIAIVLGIIVFGLGLFPPLTAEGTSLQLVFGHSFLFELLGANVFLVLLNMLPAFPMDGGRVLRALLATRLSYVRATEIAARVGVVMAVLMGMAGLFVIEAPTLVLVAGFVFLAGQAELMAVRRREALRHAEPIDVVPADGDHADPYADHDASGFDGFTWDSRYRAWVQWRNGRPVNFYRTESE